MSRRLRVRMRPATAFDRPHAARIPCYASGVNLRSDAKDARLPLSCSTLTYHSKQSKRGIPTAMPTYSSCVSMTVIPQLCAEPARCLQLTPRGQPLIPVVLEGIGLSVDAQAAAQDL